MKVIGVWDELRFSRGVLLNTEPISLKLVVVLLESVITLYTVDHNSKSSEQLISQPIKTIGQICRQQGQKLIEELIIFAHEQLQHSLNYFRLFFTKSTPQF